MRCGCPFCDGYMIQSDSDAKACVCPHCLYRCNACQGTATAITREELQKLKHTDWFAPSFEGEKKEE